MSVAMIFSQKEASPGRKEESGLLPLRFSSQLLKVSMVPMLCPWSTDQYLNVGYEWAQEKKNRSTRETAVRYTRRPLSSPYPSVPQGSQNLAFVSIWSPELCLYSLDPTLLWILWTTFGLDTLFLKGFFFIFIFILFYFCQMLILY